jgi:hypothetical protein
MTRLTFAGSDQTSKQFREKKIFSTLPGKVRLRVKLWPVT